MEFVIVFFFFCGQRIYYFILFLFSKVIRATNLIKSAMRFKLSLDETFLEPDIYHLKPEKSDTDWFKNIIRSVLESLHSAPQVLFEANDEKWT